MEDFKMKVTFSYPTRTLSGKQDETVFGAYRNNNICLARKFIYPEITEHNHSIGAVTRNVATVYHAISATYKQDLQSYAKKNGRENVPNNQLVPSSYAIFMKMMRAWAKSDPEHVDLATITLADIVALDAEVRTIKRAVAAGYLPHVSGYEALTAGIQ